MVPQRIVPFEDHKKCGSDDNQRQRSKYHYPRVESPFAVYTSFLFEEKIAQHVLYHRESYPAQEYESRYYELQYICVTAVEVEQIAFEQAETGIIESHYRMKDRVIRLLVKIQKRRVIAPVEKYQHGTYAFDYERGIEYFLQKPHAVRKIALVQRILYQSLVFYAYAFFGQYEEKSGERYYV